jgi:hypothetical protein
MSSNISYDEPVINWGPWSRLPNGQWHREGQDSLGILHKPLFQVIQALSLIIEIGNWYEDNRDVDPRVPRTQPGEGYDDVADDLEGLTLDSPPSAYYQGQNPYQGQNLAFGGYNPGITLSNLSLQDL